VHYGFNDPINFTDPTGLWEGEDPGDVEDYSYDEESGMFRYKGSLKEVGVSAGRMGMQDRMEFRNI
jgi:hypothetical protein